MKPRGSTTSLLDKSNAVDSQTEPDLPLVAIFLGVRSMKTIQPEMGKLETDGQGVVLTTEAEEAVSSTHSTPLKTARMTCEEVLNDSSQPTHFVLKPGTPFMRFWSLLRDLCLFYSFITSSYYLAFHYPGSALVIADKVIWAIFVVDLLMQFVLAYQNEDDELEEYLPKIAIHYICTYFFLDLLAIIPLQFFDNAEIEYYFRMVRLVKVKQTLNLLDGEGLGQVIPFFLNLYHRRQYVISIKDKHVVTIFFILLYIAFLTYTVACVWFWFSTKLKDGPQSYFYASQGIRSFIDKMPIGATHYEIMERSWYFMMTTLATIGYGDYGAANLYETLFLIFVLLIGVTGYSTIIGQFNVIVSEIQSEEGNSRLSDFHMWIKEIEAVQGRIKASLRFRLIQTFTIFDSLDRLKNLMIKWWEADDVDGLVQPSDPYLQEMPEGILRELKEHLFGDLFEAQLNFFGKTDFKYDVCLHLHPRRYEENKYIFEEGEDVHEVLLVVRGRVAIGPILNGEFSNVLTLPQRCIVGDYFCFLHLPAFASFRAVGTEAVFGFAIPEKVFNLLLLKKYREQAKHLFVKANVQAKFAMSAIEVHLAHLKLKKGQSDKLSVSVLHPRRDLRGSIFESVIGKEAQFVSDSQRSFLESMDEADKVRSSSELLITRWKQVLEASAHACKAACNKVYYL